LQQIQSRIWTDLGQLNHPNHLRIEDLRFGHNQPDKKNAGPPILQGNFRVAIDHGRPKSRLVVLHQKTLQILRPRGDTPVSVQNISVENLLIVAYHSAKYGPKALSIYWMFQSTSGSYEVRGCDILFDSPGVLQLWAGFLAISSPVRATKIEFGDLKLGEVVRSCEANEPDDTNLMYYSSEDGEV